MQRVLDAFASGAVDAERARVLSRQPVRSRACDAVYNGSEVASGSVRAVMLLAGGTSLRDGIAFPKTTAARGLFKGAPSPMADEELRDVHVKALRPGS